MKLASYRDGSRDGQLVVVSRDLTQAHYASGIASRLQQVLEDWNFLAPQLQTLYDELNAHRARHAFPFDAAQCLAPMPRAHRWVSATAYPGAAGDPLVLEHGAGDAFAPRCGAWSPAADVPALDCAAGLAVITGDVAPGALPEQAGEGVRLLMCALVLRSGRETLDAAFGPVAVTPDELGDAWRGARAALTLQVLVRGRKLGLCETDAGMAPDFGGLIAQLARHRGIAAGSVIGALPVRSPDAARGYCSLADKRDAEARRDGAPTTDWLQPGDALHVEARMADGERPLGAITRELAAQPVAA